MAIARCHVELQGASALPDDIYVNTFHIDTGGASVGSVAGDIHDALVFFYNGVSTTHGQVSDIASRLSEYITATATTKIYDLGDAEPRVPITDTFTLDSRASTNLPEEIAVCLSYRAAPPKTARRRGRIYLGPLGLNAYSDATSLVPTRVATQFQSDLCRAGAELQDNLLDALCTWVVYSTADGVETNVIAAWHCDNAFDVQRRRGAAPSTRATYP